MMELETMQALLTVTITMDTTSRCRGGWALRGLMADLGIAPAQRQDLATHLVAMRKVDMLLRDVKDGPIHAVEQRFLEDAVHRFYVKLLDSLPETMLVAN